MGALPKTPSLFANRLRNLRQQRRARKVEQRPLVRTRKALSPREREQIFEKTGGKCHLCGGGIAGPWQADHVFAHSTGGVHQLDNYLPAHSLCNNYRWDYSAEEFQQILKLGVWLRAQIERETPIGIQAARRYLAHEVRRISRQRTQGV